MRCALAPPLFTRLGSRPLVYAAVPVQRRGSRRAAATASALVLGLAGCGGGDDSGPATADVPGVHQLVSQLQTAIAGGDAATICNELYSRDLRKKGCEDKVRSQIAPYRSARLKVDDIFRGKKRPQYAGATVTTTEPGEKPFESKPDFVLEDGRWRLVEQAGFMLTPPSKLPKIHDDESGGSGSDYGEGGE